MIMSNVLKAFYIRSLAIYLIVALLAISTLEEAAEAMFVPITHSETAGATSHIFTSTAEREKDLRKLQSVLESEIIRQRLTDYGLSSREAIARLNRLSNEQIHQLAANIDSLQAGSDGGMSFPAMLLMILIIFGLTVIVHWGACHIFSDQLRCW